MLSFLLHFYSVRRAEKISSPWSLLLFGRNAVRAGISLTHGALTTCETLKAVLVQRAAVLAEVLDEREVTACTPDANGHVGFTFSTPALVREIRLAWEFKLAEKPCNVRTSATSNSSSYRPTTHNRCVPRAASM